MKKMFFIIPVFLMFTMPALADYNFDGVPYTDQLRTVKYGTVRGGVYVDGGHGIDRVPYTQSFSIPEGNIIWARLYVGVWGGNEEKTGSIEVTYNGIELDTLELAGKDDTNPEVYCTGNGVYWIVYDVTSNTTSGQIDAEVMTGGDIDGRVYGVMLVAVYEEPDGEEVNYWINEGNVNLHGRGWSGKGGYTNDEAVAEFPGTVDLDRFAAARLSVVYLTGTPHLNDYLYFNDKKVCDGNNCDDIADSKRYFDFKTFDVIDYLEKEPNKVRFELGDEDYVHPVLAVLTLHTAAEGDSDLTVSSVKVPALYVGSSNIITATIENIGKDSAYGFQAALYADNEIVSTTSISSLAGGKNKTVEFNWKPDNEGKHVLWVYADYNDRKTELCETNNNNTPLTVNVIDFTPPEIKIDRPEDGEIVDKDVITISGTVEDTDRNITVKVNGADAVLSGTEWNAQVSLSYGYNKITVSAVDGANNSATEFVLVKSLVQSRKPSAEPSADRENITESNVNDTDLKEGIVQNSRSSIMPELAGLFGVVLIVIIYWLRKGLA